MSIAATTSDLNSIHSIAEAIRALPPAPYNRIAITYADGRFAVQMQAPTPGLGLHNHDISAQIRRMLPTIFQRIAALALPAQEAALGELQQDFESICGRVNLSGASDVLDRITLVQRTVQHQQLLGAHFQEVRKWLLCPQTPPDLAYLQRHSFSQEQLRALGGLLFMECITRDHVQVVKWLLDQGAGNSMRFDGRTLLHAVILQKDLTREMAACILQHPSLAYLYSVDYNKLTPLAMACRQNSPYIDLLPAPRAADFRSLTADIARHKDREALDCLFAKAGLRCTAREVFTSDCCHLLVQSYPPAIEVAALAGRMDEILSIYQNSDYGIRERIVTHVATVWRAYPDLEISLHSASDVEGYWERFPYSIQFFWDFLRHVSTNGSVRLEYQHSLRAIPCATEPTTEQQRRSHGALMHFISDLLGYARPHSPLDSMKETALVHVRLMLVQMVLDHRRANPSLTTTDWQALLHFRPVRNEDLRRHFYCSLARTIAMEAAGTWETIFPITHLIGGPVPWRLLQYRLGWDGATASNMRGSTGMADVRNPFDTIMDSLAPEVQLAIARYVHEPQEFPYQLLPELFIAANKLESPHLRDAVVNQCIRDICYGEPCLTPQSFCSWILPILIANNSIGHPADLTQLVDICRQRVPTWVAEATREPLDDGQLAALAVVVDQFGIDTDDIGHIPLREAVPAQRLGN